MQKVAWSAKNEVAGRPASMDRTNVDADCKGPIAVDKMLRGAPPMGVIKTLMMMMSSEVEWSDVVATNDIDRVWFYFLQ